MKVRFCSQYVATFTLVVSAFAYTPSASAGDLNTAATGASVDAAKKAASSLKDPCAPAKKAPGEWDLSGNIGFNATSGNADTLLLTAGLNALRETDSDNYYASLQGAEGKNEEETVQRFLRLDGGWQHLYTDRLYAVLGTAYLSDDIADVDYRVFANPGVGYYLLKDDDVKLNLEGGPSYVWQKQGGESDNFLAARIANGFEWKLSETSKFFQKAEVLLNTDDTEDFLLNAEAGIEAAISTQVALFVKAIDRFDNLPAAGFLKNDVIVTSGLKFLL